MNGNRTLKVAIAALLGAGTMAAAPALAQELPNFEEWQCRFCPFPEQGLSGSAGTTVLHVSDDSARFGDYTGLDEDGVYVNPNANLTYRGADGYAVVLDARDVGLDSRAMELRAGRQGSWVVELSWDEIPRRADDTGRTSYSGLGSDTLTLPDGWVRGNFSSDFATHSLEEFKLGWDRKTAGLGLEFVQSQRLRYELDYSHQTKEGRGLTWGNFLGTAADLTKPLDYETHQVDAAIIYAEQNWNVRLAYYGSFFSNKDWSLTWENPFNGPERGRMAMAPDNRYNQGILSAGYRFSTWDTAVNASYAYGRMEQNDGLLPYTINPLLVSQALPRQRFDGQVDTTHANLRVSSRPMDRLLVSAEYRYSERDNKSGQYEWQPIQGDSFATVPFVNPLYSFENRDLSLLADYRFSRMLQGAAGWQQKIRERDDQNVRRNEEDSYWARVRFRPVQQLTLTLRGETASRDASEYQQVPATGAGAEQNPLLRKYNQADRDRDIVQAQADFVPTGRFSLSLRYEQAKDRYDDSPVGLVAADYDQYAADASVQLWRAMVLSAFYSRENYDSDMVGAASFMVPNTAAPNWEARTRDRHDVRGLALAWPGLADGKLDLRAEWTHADTTGDIRIVNPLGNAPDAFPRLNSELTGAQLMADWHVNERWTVNAGWRWEKFEADDWAKDGVAPATIANVLTFGAQTQDYDVNVFLLGFRYNFVRQADE
jgi:MtrB/PioB family decaheme-associated outer membrane protein